MSRRLSASCNSGIHGVQIYPLSRTITHLYDVKVTGVSRIMKGLCLDIEGITAARSQQGFVGYCEHFGEIFQH